MVISDGTIPGRIGFRKIIRVYQNPKSDRLVMETAVTNPQDEWRIRQAWMGKYRIPKENVEDQTIPKEVSDWS